MSSIDGAVEISRRWIGLVVLAGGLAGRWHRRPAAAAHRRAGDSPWLAPALAAHPDVYWGGPVHAASTAIALAVVVRSVASATPASSTLRTPSARRTLRLRIRPPPAG